MTLDFHWVMTPETGIAAGRGSPGPFVREISGNGEAALLPSQPFPTSVAAHAFVAPIEKIATAVPKTAANHLARILVSYFDFVSWDEHIRCFRAMGKNLDPLLPNARRSTAGRGC
jgi:hypothetical protein